MKEIALGLVNNQYFCSDQLTEHDARLLPMIFMPVALMDKKILDKWKKDDVVHLAAPMQAAIGSRSINGYPFFAECMPLTREDYAAVRGLETKLRGAIQQTLKEGPEGPRKVPKTEEK